MIRTSNAYVQRPEVFFGRVRRIFMPPSIADATRERQAAAGSERRGAGDCAAEPSTDSPTGKRPRADESGGDLRRTENLRQSNDGRSDIG